MSVLIPSYMRPPLLLNCLRAMEAQTRLPDEVVVVLRDTDTASRETLNSHAAGSPLAIRIALVSRPGQMPAMNTGLGAVTGDVVCITDDDAEPFPDWVARIEDWFVREPGLGGVGGRDHIHREGVPMPAVKVRTIGKLEWFGRAIGNHSQDSDGPRRVDILKGCNMAFRLSARPRFDERLRGDAYQNELGVCLGISRQGLELVYDPAIRVNHYLGDRHFGSARDGLTPERLFNNSHNHALIRLGHFGPLRLFCYFAYALLIGDSSSPGLVKALQLARGRASRAWSIVMPSCRGRMEALRTHRTPNSATPSAS